LPTKVYVQATATYLEEIDDLVALYALVSSIRLVASSPVIDASEEFAQSVTKRYGEKNLSLEDLSDAAVAPDHVDPLNTFSTRCRDELQSILRNQASSLWSLSRN
jgi:hypothetical protein